MSGTSSNGRHYVNGNGSVTTNGTSSTNGYYHDGDDGEESREEDEDEEITPAELIEKLQQVNI